MTWHHFLVCLQGYFSSFFRWPLEAKPEKRVAIPARKRAFEGLSPVSGSVTFCKESLDSDKSKEVDESVDSFWGDKAFVDANPPVEIKCEDRLDCERVSDNETLDKTDSETVTVCEIKSDSDKDSDPLTDWDAETDSEADALKYVDVSDDSQSLVDWDY